MANKMEEPIIEEYPIIQNIKDIMLKNGGALGAIMSGSGPTVFGLFAKEEDSIIAGKKLLNISNRVYKCETI